MARNRRFLLKAALTALIVAGGVHGAMAAFGARYSIGIDPQISRCLPDTRAVLIDRSTRTVERGDLVAFRAQGLAPWFADGTTMVKVVAALPGDRVSITPAAVLVNGEVVGEGLALAGTLGRAAHTFAREMVVEPGQVFVMGRTADSYDSRYWGAVTAPQIQGRAFRLF